MTTYKVQNHRDAKIDALVDAYNDLQERLTVDGYSHYHLSKTTTTNGAAGVVPSVTALTVTATNASTASTLYTLSENIRGVLKTHFEDDAAHHIADSVNVNFDGYADVTSTATAILFLNAVKVDFNAHLSQTNVHENNDSNTVATSDATDLSSSYTLANALKSAINTHMASGPSSYRIRVLK